MFFPACDARIPCMVAIDVARLGLLGERLARWQQVRTPER
jgi:hypothetical protein